MRFTYAKKIGATAAVLAMAAAGAGCQQQAPGQAGSGASQGGGAAAPALPGTDWKKMDYAQVKDGGKLTLSISQLPDNWNSGHADGALADLSKIRYWTGYGQSVLLDEKGKARLNPDYLESATLKSQDPQVVEVKYNKKAVWEDGSPITIKDLQAYAKAMSGADEKYEVASTDGWQDIESVTQTADEYTGEIKFKNKTADWIQYLYPEIPAAISSNPETFNKAYVAKNTPSSGPFKVASIDSTGQVVTLDRNPKWWGRKAKLDQVVFKVTSQAQEPQSFQNGELDFLDNIVTGDSFQAAKGRADAKIYKSLGTTWTHVTMNATRGALKDPKVREAIAKAINRDVIGQVAVAPLEAPVTLVNNGVFMPGQEGYEDSYDGKLSKADPAAAEQILKDAGYAKGSDGIYAKDGQKLEFKVIVPSGTKSNENRAAQIAKDLNAIGFKVEQQGVPTDQYFKNYINKKNFDMVTFSWVGTAFPIATSANLFSPLESKQNYTGFANPKVAELDAQAQAEFDQSKRVGIANEMSKAMLNDFTIVPFYATPNVVATNDKLVNFGASQFESPDYTAVGFSA